MVYMYFIHLHFIKIHSVWNSVPGDCSIFSPLLLFQLHSFTCQKTWTNHQISRYLTPQPSDQFHLILAETFFEYRVFERFKFHDIFSHSLHKFHILGQSNKTTYIRETVNTVYFFILDLLFF